MQFEDYLNQEFVRADDVKPGRIETIDGFEEIQGKFGRQCVMNFKSGFKVGLNATQIGCLRSLFKSMEEAMGQTIELYTHDVEIRKQVYKMVLFTIPNVVSPGTLTESVPSFKSSLNEAPTPIQSQEPSQAPLPGIAGRPQYNPPFGTYGG